MLNALKKMLGKWIFGVDDVEETLTSLRNSSARNHQSLLVEQRISEGLHKVLFRPIGRCVESKIGVLTPSTTIFEMMASYVRYTGGRQISLLIGEGLTMDDFSDRIKDQAGYSHEFKWQDAIGKLFDDIGGEPIFVFVWIYGVPKDEYRFRHFADGFRYLSEKRKIVLVLCCPGGPNALGAFSEATVNLETIP